MEMKKDSKEEFLRKSISGENPAMEMQDTFEFACVQCGKCCRNREDILLNPLDVFRLCKGLNLSFSDLVRKYGDLYSGGNSKLPLVRIKFRETLGVGLEKDGTRCPFLGIKNGLSFCRVHAFKPFVCYSYPLGRIVSQDQSEARYFFQKGINCAGVAKAREEGICQTTSEWLRGEENIAIENLFNRAHFNFFKNYRQWIDIEKLSKTGSIYEGWFWAVTTLLYDEYDYSKDEKGFVEQFENRILLIKDFCEKTIQEYKSKINLTPKRSI